MPVAHPLSDTRAANFRLGKAATYCCDSQSSDMKKQDAVLSLNPEAIDTVEKIIEARQRQRMPFDRDTVLSGIVNTYATHALEALQTSERFRPI